MDEDRVFKALADASRRALLDRLKGRSGLTLGELCDGHAMSRQAVTKHLAVLEEAGLVVSEKVGRERHHFLNPLPIHAIALRWISTFEQPRLAQLSELASRLEAENDREG